MTARAQRVLNFLVRPGTRYVLAWGLALTSAAATFLVAWTAFNMPKRADGSLQRRGGNSGHTTVDFGGQFLMGRMLAAGFAWQLYHRNLQLDVLREAYPRDEEVPAAERPPESLAEHEAESLLSWLVNMEDPQAATAIVSFLAPWSANHPLAVISLAATGDVDAQQRVRSATAPQIGGPLYPPIHAFVMGPLGYLRPAVAYRSVQIVGIVLAFVGGWGIRSLSDGRIWWPVATTAIMLFPGYSNSLNLGQNSILMVTLLILGWAFVGKDRPILGGICWGLLAFKPVWAVAFFLVPLLTGRWRFAVAMLLTGLGQVVLTVPFVGWHSWLHWFQIGRKAAAIYDTDENWIFLSRDLLSIPRRWLLDFQLSPAERDNWSATIAGWTLLLACVAYTAGLTLSRRDRRQVLTGPPAAFVLLGAWLSCFHFMFYDILLAALPVLLLFTEPRRYFTPQILIIASIPASGAHNDIMSYLRARLPEMFPACARLHQPQRDMVWIRNSLILTLVVLLAISDFLLPALSISASFSAPTPVGRVLPLPVKFSTAIAGTPWSTFCLIGLWLWCGWLWIRVPQPGEGARNAHLATEPASLADVPAVNAS